MTPASHAAAGRRPDLPSFYELVQLDDVDSTNAEAGRRARVGAREGTLVWATRQNAGRGRLGKRWSSPPDNLYMSLLLRPGCAAAEAAQVSFAAALGVGEALSAMPLDAAVHYKWPNDVLLGGRKVAGILLESSTADGGRRVDELIVGIGVNVASHPADSAYPATCLAEHGHTGGVLRALEAIAAELLEWVAQWRQGGVAALRGAWLARAAGLGARLEVRLPTATLAGTFADLDGAGALILDADDGSRRSISTGEVYFPDLVP